MLSKLSDLLKFRPVQEVRKKIEAFCRKSLYFFLRQVSSNRNKKSQINFEFLLLSITFFVFVSF